MPSPFYLAVGRSRLRALPPHFGRPEQNWALTFRMRDLKAVIAQLTGAGITVEGPESYPHGRCADLADPEGNPVQLWEPARG